MSKLGHQFNLYTLGKIGQIECSNQSIVGRERNLRERNNRESVIG